MKTTFRAVNRGFIAATLLVCSMRTGHAQARQSDRLTVTSEWTGLAEGVVGTTRFRLPMRLSLLRPEPGENNPFGLAYNVGNVSAMGSCQIFSTLRTVTPYTGRPYVYQYMRIRANATEFQAALVNTNYDLGGGGINGFTGPNVTALSSPSAGLRDTYSQILGNSEPFSFQKGATITARLVNGRLVGTIVGTGSGIISVGAQPSVRYVANFVLARTR